WAVRRGSLSSGRRLGRRTLALVAATTWGRRCGCSSGWRCWYESRGGAGDVGGGGVAAGAGRVGRRGAARAARVRAVAAREGCVASRLRGRAAGPCAGGGCVAGR